MAQVILLTSRCELNSYSIQYSKSGLATDRKKANSDRKVGEEGLNMQQLFKARLFLCVMLLVSIVVLAGCKKSSSKADYVPPIPAHLQIMLAMPPDGMTGAYYSYTLSAANGTQPYTWSIASGTLPNGLSLGSATGLISGLR